ncbi:HIT domain-containing protein [Nodosilinea sp. FACHB-131]|uniref:HIT family protein n=1 Tax=Cyanophyceae TaxID=3028117 RepID=UPI001683CF4E|nr:HIT domain-containing protein [Nodosilinea sp. FACHB-131]MBD1874233.1 HIT domain-containing protein [Nodosilinea sp. FACHB-131]
MNECHACNEVSKSQQDPSLIIYEDAYWILSHKTEDDVQAGNLIIKTKRHCKHLSELTAEEAASLGDIIQKTCLALSKVMEVAKVYVASYGERVKHVHFFVIPRTPKMPAGSLKMFLYQRVHSLLVRCGLREKLTQQERIYMVERVRKEYQKLVDSSEAS